MWRVALLSLLIVNQLSLSGQTGLKALLPTEDEAPGWRVVGETKEYSGDDLSFLINGGANLYLEYGFVEVIAASIVNEQGEELKLEVYRMGDSFGANAVYLQKRSGASDSYSVGNDAFINGGSLGFWKHHYFALLRSDRESESVIEGMKMVADIVASRIRPNGQIPDLSKKFNNRPGRVTLIRGKIALSNIYYFTTTDVFRIEEGVAIEEPGRIEIWLLYDNSHITIQRLGEVAGILSRETRFTSFMMSGDQSFRLEDKKGNIIDIEATGNYLKIIVADSKSVSHW